MSDQHDNFKTKFLEHYLSVGICALGKKDIDALVMHLLDRYGMDGAVPLAQYSNQEVSALLKAPVAKIKSLRYEAGLKYGGRVEDQAKAKLLVALTHAAIEVESKKISIILEDALAKHWLQGQLKIHGLIYDYSFNLEIIKVEAKGLFKVLAQFFDPAETADFEHAYLQLEKDKQHAELRHGFTELAKDYAKKAAELAGGEILEGVKLYLGF